METTYSSEKEKLESCPFFQVWLKSHKVFVSKSAFIFGANASGKSNFLAAMRYMDMKVEKSHDIDFLRKTKQNPFKLDKNTLTKPSFFEMIFSSESKIYRYNFEILWENIISENLFRIGTKDITSKQLLTRKNQEIKVFDKLDNNNTKSIIDNKQVATTALFISVAQNFNEKIAKEITDFYRKSLRSIDVMNQDWNYTKKRIMKDRSFKDKILKFLNQIDIPVKNLRVEEKSLPAALIEQMPQFKDEKIQSVQFEHDVYDGEGVIDSVWFDENIESEWTRTLLNILWPILDTLDRGWILLVDEFNSSLHVHLCDFIVQKIQDSNHNAQFIFATHDTNILSNSELTKDQIWFTERDKYGATDLFSLSDFEIRNWENYQSKYLNGRFGAVPFIRN